MRNVSVVTAINALASALFSIAIARILGPADLGAWSLVLITSTWIALLAGGGSNLTLRLRVAREPDRDWSRTYFGVSVLSVVLAFLTSACAVAVAVAVTGGEASVVGTSLAAGALAAGLSAQKQAQGLANAAGRTAQSLMLIAAGTAGAALFVWVWHWVTAREPTVYMAVIAYTAGTLPAVVGAWLQSRRSRTLPTPGGPRPSWRELLAGGNGFMVAALAIALVSTSDRFFLAHFKGLEVVGLYSAAAAMASISRLFPSAAGQVIFFRESRGNANPATRRKVRIVLVISQVALLLAIPIALPILYGRAFAGAVPIALVLVLAEYLMGVALIENRILSAAGRSRTLGMVSLVALPPALVLYWWSAQLGAMQLAVASLCVYGGMALALWWLRRRGESPNRRQRPGATPPVSDDI